MTSAEHYSFLPDSWDIPDTPAQHPAGEEIQPVAGPATAGRARRLKTAGGLADPPREYPHFERPDVSGLAEELGLR
jgi:hypothetical protein